MRAHTYIIICAMVPAVIVLFTDAIRHDGFGVSGQRDE